MKAVILAAGYATRLYPLTKNKPKSLLEVSGKTILEHILIKIAKVEAVDHIYLVTNSRFFEQFQTWVDKYRYSLPITVLDDGTTDNDNRLGAIADLQLAIDREKLKDVLLVLAGDNLFDFELSDFEAFFQTKPFDMITTHELADLNELKRTGVIQVDSDFQVTSFEEKPQEPKSNLAVPPFYIYRPDTIPLIREYLEEGQNPDAPGNFIPWLIGKKPVYAYKFNGSRYDIGTLESYRAVCEIYEKGDRSINNMNQFNVDLNKKRVLITGVAGFIGSNLAKKLLTTVAGVTVIGIDNMSDYYDVSLKEERLKELRDNSSFTFVKGSISDKVVVDKLFETYEPNIVVNLAAQAGVRYSITNPESYIESNLVGFFNILEACRHSYNDPAKGVEHLVYASSSSVYGTNKKVPYSTDDKVDNPVSLYAATKKSNELMAHAYSKLYGIPATGLRFFTVYGPAGRPDMAYFGFTNKIVAGKKIQIFNHGDMYRDFTYIDDIVTGVINVMQKAPDPNEDNVKYKIYNIGNNHPESLMYFVETLEKCLMAEGVIKVPAEKEFLPMQPGDVYQTYADVDDLVKDFGFRPSTSLEEGLSRFAKWYKEYSIGKKGE
jgi:nucleoside-diphosphate-sugar epimerase/dTDP-glucose pyrophosphorylase